MIQLYTNRLSVRDLTAEDIAAHHQLLSNQNVMFYLPDVMTKSLSQSEQNLQQAISRIGKDNRLFYFLCIEDRATKEFIGEIGYTVSDFTPLGKLVSVGYFILDSHWGKGYVTEAMNEVLRYAFEEDNVYRISCGCLKENAASERIMQKCGMTLEAEHKEYQWHENRLKDRVEYRLLRSEWKDRVCKQERNTNI